MPYIDTHTLIIFFQLTFSAILGLAIGFERSHKRKAAGLRTFSLVSVGSTLFAALSLAGGIDTPYAGFFDPTRIAAQVVVGIGFLGAGLIVFQGDKIHGLTTAAALWATAAIGVAVGFRFYAEALFTTLLILCITWALAYVERRMPRESIDE